MEYCNPRSRKEGLIPVYIIEKSQWDNNNTDNNDNGPWVVTWNFRLARLGPGL
jgi:hypothetical protein